MAGPVVLASFIALAAALVGGQGSVRSVIERGPVVDGNVTLVVRAVATDLRVGAYQGSLRYAPGSLQLLESAAPSGDGTRYVNPADSAQGIVRFAGFAVPGFRSDTVLRVVVRAPRGLDAASLRVVLDVVSDVDGKPLPSAAVQDSRRAP